MGFWGKLFGKKPQELKDIMTLLLETKQTALETKRKEYNVRIEVLTMGKADPSYQAKNYEARQLRNNFIKDLNKLQKLLINLNNDEAFRDIKNELVHGIKNLIQIEGELNKINAFDALGDSAYQRKEQYAGELRALINNSIDYICCEISKIVMETKPS
jgi:hypothetical protein